ncbi:phosphatase PAP2 family protein [Sphingomonas bacterium]|uniref:phosphatase PAP2 family protein n=1 Tax=Sphingomonas bacterium TaxID=1895847 RepID=UPI0015766F80|nr:phosphatase PAP2 family protein [Sphingomonas bacterium]
MPTRKNATRLERADRDASRKVNRKQDSWPMRVVGFVSDIGDQPQMRLLCASTIAIGLSRRDFHLAKTGVKMLAAHTVATWGKSSIKAVINRTRPDAGDDPAVRRGNSHAHEDNSFPSGHSAGAVAVARAFARSYPDHAIAAHVAALAVSAVQIPRGTHYVGDVAAGVVIGLVGEQSSDAVLGLSSRVIASDSSMPELGA